MAKNLLIRDLTSQFLSLRKKKASYNFDGIASYSGPSEDSKTGLIGSDQLSARPLHYEGAPLWVDTLDEINSNIERIEEKMNRNLKRLYEQAIQVEFDEEKEKKTKKEIEKTVSQITRLFRESQSLLKRIAIIGNEHGNLPQEENQLRYNAMRAKAQELQHLGKKFRSMQRRYVDKFDAQKKMGTNNIFGAEEDTSNNGLMDFGPSYTENDLMEIQELERRTGHRTEEITSIVRSVEELSQMFNELQILIVQQGTVLDRIDYNVEQTLTKLEASKKELVTAEKYQKRSMSTLCIMGLLMLIFLCAIVLIAKNAGK